jgi:arylformamidase
VAFLSKIYDISQTLREGIAVWPGDQAYRLHRTMEIRRGDSCNVAAVTLSIHTGTHLDAPYHFDESGAPISDVPLEHYVGPARLVRIDVPSAIGSEELRQLDLRGAERILFKTRSSDLPEDRFERDFAYISEGAAEYLGSLRMRLVGIDSPSVDPFDSRELRAHKILLKHQVAILEGARLAHVPEGDYELICLPLRLEGLDGSPVRAILRER